MQRLSSKMTAFHKRVVPAVLVGALLVLALVGALGGWSGPKGPPPAFFVVAVLGIAAGLFYFRKFVAGLADEVWDAGDALIVRNRGQEDRILLSDIMNVSYSQLVNPPQVALSLRTPSLFGDKVTFCPPIRIIPFGANPLIDDLIKRIDDARCRKR